MSEFKIVMPKMGESVQEATITKWFVSVGDTVEEEAPLAEIATDKVDSEIPSPIDGKIKEIIHKQDETVAVGETIAIIDMEDEEGEAGEEAAPEETEEKEAEAQKQPQETTKEAVPQKEPKKEPEKQPAPAPQKETPGQVKIDDINKVSSRFYSPLVKNMAKEENISVEELESIQGTGRDGRVKKEDMLQYIEDKKAGKKMGEPAKEKAEPAREKAAAGQLPGQPVSGAAESANKEDEVIEMSRMRKIIADHMVHSKDVAAHVTSVVEVDMTKIVQWRDHVKNEFQKREGEKLTFMPIFVEAVVKALRDFPRVNASVDGNKMVLKKAINIGIAVALEDYNLIVPVIKNADQKNLVGLTKEMNSLVKKARSNKLSPDDIQGGTFSITNFGSFQNIIGTPIISQPQAAILATGSIEKKPAVIETKEGDVIAIRHKMYLSLSYDHRIVDGALGGAFLKRIADYLENFDVDSTI